MTPSPWHSLLLRQVCPILINIASIHTKKQQTHVLTIEQRQFFHPSVTELMGSQNSFTGFFQLILVIGVDGK
jgi:hypothetical protein